MRKEYVAVSVLLAFSSFYLHARAQDIWFPGETERPSHIPLNPTTQPSTTSGGDPQQQYNACIRNCQFTSENNPVCGSDGLQYQNIGSLNCAINCGKPVRNVGRAPCTTTSTTTTTTASPTTPPPSTGPNLQNGITLQQYNNCLRTCQFTSEYNPVCGSDGTQYQNIGSMNCAVNCGNAIRSLGRAPCTATA